MATIYPKYVQEVGGQLYFRRAVPTPNGRRTVRHRLPAFTDPNFGTEYAMALAGRTDMVATQKRVMSEILSYPERGPQGTSDADLYIVQVGEYGPIKIGRSKSVKDRLRTLQTGQHEKVRLLAVGVGMGHLEPDFHYAFSAVRIQNEWFEWTRPGRAAVMMLRKGAEITEEVIERLRRECSKIWEAIHPGRAPVATSQSWDD
jgi:hypothetical protein